MGVEQSEAVDRTPDSIRGDERLEPASVDYLALHEASRQWLSNGTFNGASRGEFRMKGSE